MPQKLSLLEKIQKGVVFFDGAMGTLLQAAGLEPGELPERWNVEHPDVVRDIHIAYLSAGADIVKSNTFGANGLKYSPEELQAVVAAGMRLAKEATASCGRGYVALDIGPTGKLLKPYGDMEFERAVELFAEVVRIGAPYADCILIETMNDSYETKAAVLAAKENSSLPVFVTNVYGADGKLMTGADPKAMIAMLEGLRVDALGMNCSLGPRQMLSLIPLFYEYASVPVIVNPNAGLPREEEGRTVYDVGEEEFAACMREAVRAGARLVGGCCGTTPAFIAKLTAELKDVRPMPVAKRQQTLVSSYTHAVEFSGNTVLIGERINPTGKKRFQQALREKDLNYVLREGVRQQDEGAEILDVNVGLPDIDEAETLRTVAVRLQGVSDLPLQLDTTSREALAGALRLYNGKAMVNSVNGTKESMDAVFPLVAKYGGLVVALTLDEQGIPATAQGRLAVAEKIIAEAKKYGIGVKDLIFDPLAMTVSSDPRAALFTLEALRLLREKGYKSVLGVSNVSFGLPARETINAAFFALAMESGLNAAILNVYSAEMLKMRYAFAALHAVDENFKEYIRFATERLPALSAAASPAVPSSASPAKGERRPTGNGSGTASAVEEAEGNSPLHRAIVKGLEGEAAPLTKELLKTLAPLDIINQEIIPALDVVGRGFENKTLFLPQLLMSAEAAKAAFEEIKSFYAAAGTPREKRCTFVIATVKGDIHDIGKNIVRVLLENYGFDTVDLGKDVPPEDIVRAVEERHAPLAGLSALMTTTVPSMAETVRLLRERAPWCKIVVGGAVMTQEYADRIGADKYAKDAMETVRYAEEVERSLR